MIKEKKRLDILVLDQFPFLESRTHAIKVIQEGYISVEKKVITKPGSKHIPETVILLNKSYEKKYVSRAGYKLEHALSYFSIEVKNLVALDAGISTGGFTDCLLQKDIKKVYGIDVGTKQTHEKIASDPRVILYEKTNLKELNNLPEEIDLVTLDLSFISVTKVIHVIKKIISKNGMIIVLIKPQFEMDEHINCTDGIITDPALHTYACQKVITSFLENNFSHQGTIESPIKGGDGNKEFLAYFKNNLR